MKKNQLPVWCSLLVASSLFLNACIKPGPIVIPPAQQLARITQLNSLSSYPDSFKITYNHKGNPDKMVPGQISTGNPQFLFRYDQHNKLVARIGAYNSKEVNAYENAWVYLYDQNNRIIRDTFYTQGFYNPAGYPIIKTGQPMTSTSYSYDNKNRIIQTVEKSLYMYSNRYRITRDYYYNADNNLWKVHQVYEDVTLPDSLCAPHCPPPYIEDFYREYDNKINFRTLNPVWQFIDKDYSKNNSFKVMGYDTYGLPLEIIQPEGVAVQSTLGITVYHSLIKYQYLR